MTKTIAASALIVAMTWFASPALAACDEDGPCLPQLPFGRFIPKSLPAVPDISLPKGVLPKAAPKVIERKVEEKPSDAKVPSTAAAPKPPESEVKVVEKPAEVRVPDTSPSTCAKYFPSVGKSLDVPCE